MKKDGLMTECLALASDMMSETRGNHPTCHQSQSRPGILHLGMILGIKDNLLDNKEMNDVLTTQAEEKISER